MASAHLFFTTLARVRLPTASSTVLQRLDPPDVDTHRGVELQRLAAGGRLGITEQDADLLPKLVDENRGGAGIARDAPVSLRSAWLISRACRPTWLSPISPSISARGISAATESMTMTSIAPERISVSAISSACSPVSGCETSRLSVSTPSFFAYSRVERVLGVDERRHAAGLLRVGDRVQRERRLAAGLRAVDLDDAPSRQPADAERHVERDRPRRYHFHRRPRLVSKAHHRPLAVRALDLGDRVLEGLVAVGCCHRCHPVRKSVSGKSVSRLSV